MIATMIDTHELYFIAGNFLNDIDNIHAIIELNKKKATKADEKRDG